MKQLDDLLEKHDFEKELLNDEQFVSDAKNIMEESGLEFSKDQLKEILYGTEENLEKIRELPADELRKISGGKTELGDISQNSEHAKNNNSAAAIAIKVATTIAGTLLGGGAGLLLGGLQVSSGTEKTYNSAGDLTSTTKKSGCTVGTGSISVGAFGGSVVGYKLGTLIVNKYLNKIK